MECRYHSRKGKRHYKKRLNKDFSNTLFGGLPILVKGLGPKISLMNPATLWNRDFLKKSIMAKPNLVNFAKALGKKLGSLLLVPNQLHLNSGLKNITES